MFQWATLVTSTIVTASREMGQSVEALRTIIEELPPDLFDLYESLLSTVEQSEKALTVKLLRWVIFASEPLDIHELRDALMIDADTTAHSTSEIEARLHFVNPERDVRTLSKGLVEIQEHHGRQIAQLIHQSVHDYLFQGEGLQRLDGSTTLTETFGKAQFQLSRSCLRYLLLDDVQKKLNALDPRITMQVKKVVPSIEDERASRVDFLAAFPLLVYARDFWIVHTMHAELNGMDQRDLLDILPCREGSCKLPLILRQFGHPGFRPYQESWAIIKKAKQKLDESRLRSNALFTEPRLDFDLQIFYLLHGRRGTFSIRKSEFEMWQCQRPFELLAVAGIRSAWEEVLRETRDFAFPTFDVSPNRRGSPLLNLLFGHPDIRPEEIPRELLDTCIAQNTLISPLFYAIWIHRFDLGHIFIESGAAGDCVCVDPDDGRLSVYELAILEGDENIMRHLLDAHGGPFTSGTDSALHFAARNGKDSMVRLLLEKYLYRYPPSKFLELRVGYRGITPMEEALYAEKYQTCLLLAEAGAGIKHSRGRAAVLYDAVKSGDARLTRLWLGYGVGPNCFFQRRGESSLSLAMKMEDGEIVDMLLQDRKTDPNLRDDHGQTALMRTLLCSAGNKRHRSRIVKWIQRCVASGKYDLEVKDYIGESLLAKAVLRGCSDIVDVLLSDGQVDPNTRDVDGWTPLMKSATNGFWTITKLLLTCERTGPDVHGTLSNALCHAVLIGRMACANLILESPKLNIQASKTILPPACYAAVDRGAGGFLIHLPALRPKEFRTALTSEMYARARAEKKPHIIRKLEVAGLVPHTE